MLRVPRQLNRNCHLDDSDPDETAEYLINLAMEKFSLESLSDKNVLDIGCGVRFAAAMINREIPIQRYRGIDVHQRLIQWLKENVEAVDERFYFSWWNCHNELYNPTGAKMHPESNIPAEKDTYDLCWMFSVVTHLCPEDTENLFHIVHRYTKPNAKMLFTAFIFEDVEGGFCDWDRDKPLSIAMYDRENIENIITRTGWKLDSYTFRDPENGHQCIFTCSKS